MVEEDPEKRIAELERELAQQRRKADLERRLAAHVTVKSSRSVVYPGMGSGGPTVRRQAAFRTRRPQRGLNGASLFGALARLFGICVGGAAALTAVIPATALWASPIVCRRPYHLDYSTSNYKLQTRPVGDQRELPMRRR